MTKDATHYVEEFLFRGRREGDPQPTAWHVILGVEGADPLGRAYQPMPIMTSEQAIKAGWDIPDIMMEINAELLAELDAERRKSREAEQERDEALSLAEGVKAVAEATAEKNAQLTVELAAERAKAVGSVRVRDTILG
ncbi:hypothetical protein NL532_24045 [Mesorhizobium sp. C120A]|uniref:hypothetical protein n=1 Tax=unclassified Mesorhizobium TaxID=325217 RepID=UPI0003D02BCF|nr:MULTISPECIES: hypothetical protein [unclassified Mesorhizobium]ESZ60646.1 hypothetical protein X728_15000 [Mesorhizobium sp. L103C120A0]WJI43681.1 hypothetical protein NL532_24045 [Mesorhizobium sp. C120A]